LQPKLLKSLKLLLIVLVNNNTEIQPIFERSIIYLFLYGAY